MGGKRTNRIRTKEAFMEITNPGLLSLGPDPLGHALSRRGVHIMPYKVIWRSLPSGAVARRTSTFTHLSDARAAAPALALLLPGPVESLIEDETGTQIELLVNQGA